MHTNMMGIDNGFFKVLRYFGKNEKQRAFLWECQCRCGEIVIITTAGIKRCLPKSCKKCSYKKRGNWTNHYIPHGLARGKQRHELVKMRNRMITRCYKAKKSDFPYYQGKGIRLCDDWKNIPKSFYDWAFLNGWKEGLTIDRIDPDGNYEPLNCRFITKSENSKRIIRKKLKD